ncbi:GIY-YIG nuclease family protein, partial [Paenibacillus ehimensis]
DPFGWIKAPSSLPKSPGIYILTSEKSKLSYVGSSVNMFERISGTLHAKAQRLLALEDVIVEYVQVDLGTVMDVEGVRKRDRYINHILRHFEQIEYENQIKTKKYTMLNDSKNPPESKRKKQRNMNEIKEFGAKAGTRLRCEK